jgi:hypothetical protein
VGDLADGRAWADARPGASLRALCAGSGRFVCAATVLAPSIDPFTGAPIVPVPFHATALAFSAPQGQALPTLNLPRVHVLTGSNTCSASEAIINSLRLIDVNVVRIGATTCGKPFGFVPEDNCGTTYFSVQLGGVCKRDSVTIQTDFHRRTRPVVPA